MNINWKEKYLEIMVAYQELLAKTVRLSSVNGLIEEVRKKVMDEYNNCTVLYNNNIKVSKPIWYYSLLKLHSTSLKLLKIFDTVDEAKRNKTNVPTITRVTKTQNLQLSKTTAERHANNINQIIVYKCRDDEYFQEQLQIQCMKLWSNSYRYGALSMVGSWNTEYLQGLLQTSDHNFREFRNELHRIVGCDVFASARKCSNIRQWLRILTGRVLQLFLERSKGSGKLRKASAKKGARAPNDTCQKYFAFFMNDLEAIGLCIDSDINRNQFQINSLLVSSNPRTIFGQIAGDKQTVYGYGESAATLTNMDSPMSATRSIPTILICGDFADERRSHALLLDTIHSTFKYNKTNICKLLTDWPVVITIVLYAIPEQSNNLISRLGKSAVGIWNEKMKKTCAQAKCQYKEAHHTRVGDDIIQLDNQFKVNTYPDDHEYKRFTRSNPRPEKLIPLWKQSLGTNNKNFNCIKCNY